MWRRILPASLMLLALLTSGWGGVLAAAFCVHDAVPPATMAADHACCRARLEQQREHCLAATSEHTSHEAMAMDEMEATPTVAERESGFAVAFSQPAEACLHCASRSSLPTTFVIASQPGQKQRNTGLIAPPASNPLASHAVSFAPILPATRGAPPGHIARRHLLFSVFII